MTTTAPISETTLRDELLRPIEAAEHQDQRETWGPSPLISSTRSAPLLEEKPREAPQNTPPRETLQLPPPAPGPKRPPRNEYTGLLAQRSALVDAKLSGAITDLDQRRLDLIEWKLDQIEMSIRAAAPDPLEDMLRAQRQLAEDVEKFVASVQARRLTRPKSSRSKGRGPRKGK